MPNSTRRSVVRDVLIAINASGTLAALVLLLWVGVGAWRVGALAGRGFFSGFWYVLAQASGGLIALGVCCGLATFAAIGTVRRFTQSLTTFQDSIQRLPLDRRPQRSTTEMRQADYVEAQQLAQAVDDIQRAFSDRETRFERSKLRMRDELNQRTAEAEEASSRAYQLAMVDPLTRLPNRMMLNDELEKALQHSLAVRAFTAVMFIDVDHFKRLNDTLGHELGDKVLQHVAATLRQHLPEREIAARLGGDEFVVVMHDMQPDMAKQNVERFLGNVYASLRNPIELGERSTLITLSIGAAMYPADGHDAASMLRAADAAMYTAKQKGRNRADWYRRGDTPSQAANSEREQSLRQAIANKQLAVVFQPQARADDGMPVGVEALVRWHHPTRGLIAPSSFIKLAEQSGLIVPLGQRVLEITLAQAKRWGARDLNMRIAINLSVRQLEQQGWIESLHQLVESFDIPPSLIDLEITESVIADDPIAMEKMLRNLSQRGFTLSLDDFGTGYSSLNYLARFPINNVKIDRQFVQDIDAPGSRNVVQSIIALGHALDMRTIAEGVETPQQFRILREMGCDEVQGFFVSEPMEPDDVLNWWEQRVEATRFLSEQNSIYDASNVLPMSSPMSSGRSTSAKAP